jgi:Alginate export
MSPTTTSLGLAALLALSACTAQPVARTTAAPRTAVHEVGVPASALPARPPARARAGERASPPVLAPATALAPDAARAGEREDPPALAFAAAPAHAPAPAPDALAEEAKAAGPWRLDAALGTPKWLKLSGQQRTRYEALHNQFRAGLTGNDDLWSLRTSLRADLDFDPFVGTVEVMDSRAYGADDETPLNTSIVNALEVIQAWAGLQGKDVFSDGDEALLLAGRHTMDIGSRRLVARNRFRNTVNNFTGLDATLDTASGSAWRAFFVLPVHRRPTDFDHLDDNTIQNDETSTHTDFWGLYGSTKELLPHVAGELYYYGLDEDDSADIQTRNRRLTTLGMRVHRKPKKGELDFEVESAYQFGEARASSSAGDTTDLDVSAHFEHAELGYTFPAEWKPRLVFQFDYASGDRNPNDGDYNRFDTLYGARRFDWGPTGIYGPFARANLITPGLRLQLEPSDKVDLFVADRFYYLASDTDAWVDAGVVDPTGSSGDYIGSQAELRTRWQIVPENLELEFGFAYLFEGGFAENAPNATGEGDPRYVYVQTTVSF